MARGVPRASVRRPISITVLALLFLVALVALPIGLLIGLMLDTLSAAVGNRQLRRTRTVLLVCSLIVIDFISFLAVLVILAAGTVTSRDRRNARLHWMMKTWTTAIMRAISTFVPMTIDETALAQVPLNNSIIVARHRSHLDAVLPASIIGRSGLMARYTLKEDLRWEPNIDLVGHALPHRFVTRAPENLDAELDRIRELAGYIDQSSAALIFPEGTFFTEQRKQQIIASLERRDPRHAEAARAMRYLLPPRPAGTLALLDGAPDADVVILGHTGFEPFGSIPEILRNLGGQHSVRVFAQRIPRSDIPRGREARIDWLFDRWLELDRAIAAHHGAVPHR